MTEKERFILPQAVPPPTAPQPVVSSPFPESEERIEFVEEPAVTEESVLGDEIPEAGLTKEDEEAIFGTEEPAEGEAGEGDFSDVLELSPEDNEDLFGTSERKPKYRLLPKARRIIRRIPPQILGGIR